MTHDANKPVAGPDAVGSTVDQAKARQAQAFDDWYTSEHQLRDRNLSRLAQFLEQRHFDRGLAMLNTPLAGRSVITVCSGLGREADWFARRGAHVTATDLSPQSVAYMTEHYPQMNAQVADAEHLPFDDNTFDIAAVRYGLHHLPRPIVGLCEMLRVARRHVIIWEGHDSPLVRLMAGGRLFGLLPCGGTVEPSGNYVYRFTRRELAKTAHAMFLGNVRCRAEWFHNNDVLERWHHRLFDGPVGYPIGRGIYAAINTFIGRWGNNLVAVFDLDQ